MFAGTRRKSSNVRVMQLFHELKQQFPTVPDHVVTACIGIAAHSNSRNNKETIREILEAAQAVNQPDNKADCTLHDTNNNNNASEEENEEDKSMGCSPCELNPTTPILDTTNQPPDIPIDCSNNSESDSEEMTDNISENSDRRDSVSFSKQHDTVCLNTTNNNNGGKSRFFVKRPNHLDIKPDKPNSIQLSEKCRDVFKLLNSDNISVKPPKSPSSNPKRLTNQKECSHETRNNKKQTVTTPTQTTDTLLGGNSGGNSVNLSLNVNCSMDVVQSPTINRRTSTLTMTPQQPWLFGPDTSLTPSPSSSPRSYTSVNLFLRPPSTQPQPPIDITSKNSSLTYSTSSFDKEKGLQSRLQITVGPGGGSSVASVRTRPRSSYLPEQEHQETVPVRAGSLNNLAQTNEPPVILKQQARIERLRIELKTEKTNLIVMQKEVAELEKNHIEAIEFKIDKELEKQLRREIQHLQYQCEQLALEVDKNSSVVHEDFYNNIYTGQRGPLDLTSARLRRPNRGRTQINSCISNNNNISNHHLRDDNEGPKWNCHLCTFLNHPDLDKCEQCEMPRILHVSASPGDNIHIHVTPRLSRRVVHSWVL